MTRWKRIPLFIAFLMCISISRADDRAIRDAVARSLPFLEKEGVAWIEERDCMSCHHVPFMVWTHRASKKHGLTIDEKKLAGWEEWCRTNSLSHRNHFALSNYDINQIDDATLPKNIRDKLRANDGEAVVTEAEFVAKVKPLLTEEDWKLHGASVIKVATLKPYSVDRTGGGLDVQGQLLLGSHGSASSLSQRVFRNGIVEMMNDLQLADGSWTPGNQFTSMRRWSVDTANQATTMWAALALACQDEADARVAATLEKASAFVRQPPGDPDNREWLATRLLFEHRLGKPDDVAKYRQQLIDSRNEDGAWGWEKGMPSDAQTTGLALYALTKNQPAADATIVDHARRWLLAAQEPDGSWKTPARNITKVTDPDRLLVRDEIYHYWGTGWSAIGLLESLNQPRD